MKNKMSIVAAILLVMAIMLCACGNQNKDQAKETAAPSATPTAAPSATPTAAPSATPTAAPSATPTAAPSAAPTANQTSIPDEVIDPEAEVFPPEQPNLDQRVELTEEDENDQEVTLPW